MPIGLTPTTYPLSKPPTTNAGLGAGSRGVCCSCRLASEALLGALGGRKFRVRGGGSYLDEYGYGYNTQAVLICPYAVANVLDKPFA